MNETVTRMKYGLTKSLIKFLGGEDRGRKGKREWNGKGGGYTCIILRAILHTSFSHSNFCISFPLAFFQLKEDEGQLFKDHHI